MESTLYIHSPHILFNQRENVTVISHNITAKNFTVSNELSSVISGLNAGKSKTDILHFLSKISNAGDSESCFSFLVENDIILDSKNEDRKYYLKRISPILLGLASYQKSQKNKVVFVGIPSSAGNNIHLGCASFPLRIRQITNGYNLSNIHEELILDFVHHILDSTRIKEMLKSDQILDGGDLSIDSFESWETISKRIYQLSNEMIFADNLPFFLGGDHLISYPIIMSLKNHYRKVQVIQFDAHTDAYRTAEDKRSVLHHGNFIKALLEQDHIDKIIQIGIRGLPNIRQSKQHAKQHIIAGSMLLETINDTRHIESLIDPNIPTYISFDIDFINPLIAPGTSTPVCGGLALDDTLLLLHKILSPLNNIIGIDIIEVNPELDEKNKTMEVATILILSLLSLIKK
jgi:agmatinase